MSKEYSSRASRTSHKDEPKEEPQEMPTPPSGRTTSFRRKNVPQETPDIKTPRTGKPNRLTERSFDQVSVTSSNLSGVGGTEEENERMMVLSNEARESLISMQRFDRFIYVAESEKHLKVPIEAELRRLEKIKNAGNKLMKNTYFDTELTITCLYNHMKNLYELNRDLGEIVNLKAEIELLQQKIIEQNMKYNKDVKQAANQAKGKAAEDQQTLRDTLKVIETIISALKETNASKGQKKLQGQIKRATDTRKELLQLIHNLLSRAGGGAVQENIEGTEGGTDLYQHNLDKLIQDQGSVDKNLSYLATQKTFFEKSIKETKIQDTKRIFNDLKETCLYLIALNTTIKDSEQAILLSQKKAVTVQGQSESEKQAVKRLQELESIINAFEADGVTWHKELELINIKVEKSDNVAPDVNKNRKLLGGKKAVNPTVSSLVTSYLDLLELHSQGSKSSQDSKQLQDRYNKLEQNNVALEKELTGLRKLSEGQNQKGQAEITKLITMLEQMLFKENGEAATGADLQKVKKYIEINRRKFPEDFQTTLNSIEALIKTIIDNDQYMRQKELEDQRNEQLQNKEIINIDGILKALEKLLSSNDAINDGYINKLRKMIEQNSSKIDKLPETPVNNLIRTSNLNTNKLFDLLADTHKNSKNKGEAESESKQELDSLRNQLKQKELDLQKSNKASTDVEKNITSQNSKISELNVQLNNSAKEVAALQRSLKEAENKANKGIESAEKEAADLEKKLASALDRIEEYKATITQLKETKQSQAGEEKAKDKEIKDLHSKITALEREAQRSAKDFDGLNKQIVDLNSQLTLLKQQYNIYKTQSSSKDKELQGYTDQVGTLKQSIVNLNLEITSLHQQIDQLNSQREGQIHHSQQLEHQMESLKAGVSDEKLHISNLSLQNNNLRQENEYLRGELERTNVEIGSLNTQISGARNQDSQQLLDVQRELDALREIHEREKITWQRDQTTQGEAQNDLRNRIKVLENEKTKIQKDAESQRSQYQTLQTNFNTQQGRFQQLQKSLGNQQKQTSESSRLQKQLSDSESNLNASDRLNRELQEKLHNNTQQLTSLLNKFQILESKLRDKTTEVDRIRAEKLNASVDSSQYHALRYNSLKEENRVLKEQIILRDRRIRELEGNRTVPVEDLSTIKRLEEELNYLRRGTPDLQRMVTENQQLHLSVAVREGDLQNAATNNENLLRELNRHKDIEAGLQTHNNSLVAELNFLRSNVTNAGRDVTGQANLLRVQIEHLNSDKVRLENQNRTSEKTISELNNDIYLLKQRVRSFEDGDTSHKRVIENLKHEMKTGRHLELERSNSRNEVMEVKIQELEITVRNLSTRSPKSQDEASWLKKENLELRDRLNRAEQTIHARGADDTEDRIIRREEEFVKEKNQYIKTIKSMQMLLQSKDSRLSEMFDRREEDLQHLINENKKLQEEVNRINEKLIKEKVKTLISPKSLEQSLAKMESELVVLRRENVVLKEEIHNLEHELVEMEKEKSVHSQIMHSEGRASSNVGLERGLYDRVKILEVEKTTLLERVSLLSVFHRIENQQQALVSNVNRLIDNLLVFLSNSEDFVECDFSVNEFLPAISECLSKSNYEDYFEHVEDFFKDLFLRAISRKNDILDKQAQQLLLLREKMEDILNDQMYEDEEMLSRSFFERSSTRGMHVQASSDTKKKASLIALQHLFKLYLKAKDPGVLREISEMLSISHGRSRALF